ncbi:MAG: hypothetical protein ACXV7C_04640 [Candidatus Angelobacter sp.]
MPRGILLIAGLTVLSAVSGQGQTANQSTTTTPVAAPFGGPILVTPSASFPSPVPTAGISNAGRAGISNATSGVETTTAPSSPETIVTTEPTPANDLGPSAFVGGASEASTPSISVAEVSSRYKAEKATRNARVLGNEDVQSILNNKTGVTMAKNMPPLGRGALEQGIQTQNAGIQAGATQPAPQSAQANAPATQPEQGASSQVAAAPSGQKQAAVPETEAENSTTPQINQNQQPNDAQGSRRLPATATFLPLLGLLGLLSGGIGFWFRKFRN